jgi:putative resolvase
MTRGPAWAAQPGLPVVRVGVGSGSGMNGAGAGARRLLADPAAGVVVVEHRGRLGRVNAGLVEAALAAHGRRLVVLDGGEVTGNLVRDMIEVLTSFCARLYGRRSARDRALKAVGCAQRDIGHSRPPKAARPVARRPSHPTSRSAGPSQHSNPSC